MSAIAQLTLMTALIIDYACLLNTAGPSLEAAFSVVIGPMISAPLMLSALVIPVSLANACSRVQWGQPAMELIKAV